jgi:hypothetical protein
MLLLLWWNRHCPIQVDANLHAVFAQRASLANAHHGNIALFDRGSTEAIITAQGQLCGFDLVLSSDSHFYVVRSAFYPDRVVVERRKDLAIQVETLALQGRGERIWPDDGVFEGS